MKRSGILVGYPDGIGRQIRSRYEAAIAVNAAYTNLRYIIDGWTEQNRLVAKGETNNVLDAQELKETLPVVAAVQRLAGEFPKELGELGVDVGTMQFELRLAKRRLANIRIAQFGEARGAFPDVKPGHWAYEATRKMREEGVLQGYPARAFATPKAVEPWWIGDFRILKRDGVIGSMPGEGLIHGCRPPTNFESAVMVYTAYKNPKNVFGHESEKSPSKPGERANARRSTETTIRLVDTFTFELEALGVDVLTARADLFEIQARMK